MNDVRFEYPLRAARGGCYESIVAANIYQAVKEAMQDLIAPQLESLKGELGAVRLDIQRVEENLTSKIQGVTRPAKLKIASVPTVMAIASWETIRSRRRSIMSASAPAGSPNRKKGRLSAVRSKETMSGDGVSDDISQPCPTSVI